MLVRPTISWQSGQKPCVGAVAAAGSAGADASPAAVSGSPSRGTAAAAWSADSAGADASSAAASGSPPVVALFATSTACSSAKHTPWFRSVQDRECSTGQRSQHRPRSSPSLLSARVRPQPRISQIRKSGSAKRRFVSMAHTRWRARPTWLWNGGE